MKKVVKKLTAGLLASSLILVSCKKLNDVKELSGKESVYNFDKNQLSMIEFIEKNYGVKRELISFKNKYVFFDDVCLRETDLLEMIVQKDEKGFNILGVDDTIVSVFEKQRLLNNSTVSISKSSNIKIYVAPSILTSLKGDDWNSMINQAISEFNLIFQNTNSNLRFIRTNSPDFDIVIAFESDETFAILPRPDIEADVRGWARFPFNGEPGNAITISNTIKNDSYNQVHINTIMHEMMHTIGFAHNNSLVNTDLIPQTSSVTNQKLPEWLAELSNNDILSLMKVYPKTLSAPIWPIASPVVKQSSGTVKITYRNPSHVTKPYYYIEVIKYNASGTTVLARKTFKAVQAGNSGNQIITWGGHTAGQTYQFAVKGLNFRKDKGSIASSKKSITL